MKTQQFFIIVVLCVVLPSVTLADPTWVEVREATASAPEVTMIYNNTDSIVFTVTIPGFYKIDSTYDDTTYQRIWFLEEAVMADSGFPELPIVIKKIAVPECDSVYVNGNFFNPDTLNNYLLFPAPNTGDTSWVESFCKNDSVYATSTYYPNINIQYSGRNGFRDQCFIEVTLMPITFSPDSQKIAIWDSVSVVLTFDDVVGSTSKDVGMFNLVAESMFLNYSAESDGYIGGTDDATYEWIDEVSDITYCDYLIITAGPVFDNSNAKSKIEELAKHRVDLNGFYVCLMNVEDISGWDDPDGWEDIREFIHDVYNAETSLITSDHHLPFVLLVGDAWDDDGWGGGDETTPLLPRTEDKYFYNNELQCYKDHGNDHYYSDLDYKIGHWRTWDVADVALGRFPVGTYNELEYIVNKTITFETEMAPQGYEDWRNTIALQLGHGENMMYSDNTMANVVNEIENADFYDYYTIYQYPFSSTVVSADEICNITEEPWQYDILDEWLVPIFNGSQNSPHIQNDPKGMLAYFFIGHGGAIETWANTYFSDGLLISNMTGTWPSCAGGVYSQIRNTGRWPIMYLGSCWVGYWDCQEQQNCWKRYDCLAEQYTVKDEWGAVAAIAPTKFATNLGVNILPDYFSIQFGNEQAFSNSSLYEMIGWSFLSAKNLGSPYYVYFFSLEFMLFGDPALNMFIRPTGSTISQNTTWEDRVDIIEDVTVYSGVTLTVSSGTEVYFSPGTSIIVQNGATIDVNGTSSNPVVFQGRTGVAWNGIIVNSGGTAYFDYAEFDGNSAATLSCTDATVSIDNCTFENMDNAIDLTECDNVDISYCTISNCEGFGICGLTCDELVIDVNSIVDCDEGGIYLNNCTNTEILRNENIEDNGLEETTSFGGIHLDDSSPDMRYNWVEDNIPYQLVCMDGSTPSLVGDSESGINTLWTNDRGYYPIYVIDAFPELKQGHNNIVNMMSDQYILVYDASENVSSEERKMQENWWGTSSPGERQFYPEEANYNFSDPDRDINKLPGGSNPYTVREETAWAMFNQALALEKQGLFSEAISLYQAVAENYPHLSVGTSSLLRIKDCAVAGELNLATIRDYYVELSHQPFPEEFQRRAYLESISIKVCAEDYYSAINDYEDILLSEPSLLDSIQAAIDVGMVWLLVELNGGQGPVPNNINRIPSLRTTTVKEYREKVKELWALRNGVENLRNAKVPVVYELYQNYPNPFNPTTQICYYLPSDSRVMLKIYNILGRHVITLVDDIQASGFKRVFWDGKNSKGIELASGIYFYRLEAKDNIGNMPNFESIRKMVLIK